MRTAVLAKKERVPILNLPTLEGGGCSSGDNLFLTSAGILRTIRSYHLKAPHRLLRSQLVPNEGQLCSMIWSALYRYLKAMTLRTANLREKVLRKFAVLLGLSYLDLQSLTSLLGSSAFNLTALSIRTQAPSAWPLGKTFACTHLNLFGSPETNVPGLPKSL